MKRHFITLSAAALLLTACDGGVKDTLGLNREAPDEFTVVSRPPLSLPPDFSLRPPQPGAEPHFVPADQRAQALVTGKGNTGNLKPAARTSATENFLRRTGAHQADTAIRDKLAEDAAAPADTSKAKTLVDQISGAQKREPVVDPQKETERLKSNRAAGKPVNEGEVPETKSETESLIDRIF